MKLRAKSLIARCMILEMDDDFFVVASVLMGEWLVSKKSFFRSLMHEILKLISIFGVNKCAFHEIYFKKSVDWAS